MSMSNTDKRVKVIRSQRLLKTSYMFTIDPTGPCILTIAIEAL
jgi:hypothetical protein